MAAQATSDKHVFISYAREDQLYARELADEVRERGFEIWMDDRIDFGARWWREIVKAIRASAAFVVVMTPDSEESDWVEREILLPLEEALVLLAEAGEERAKAEANLSAVLPALGFTGWRAGEGDA